MKCQRCLVREASFHYKSNINGEISEQHLCANCAGIQEGHLFAHTLANPMDALLGGGIFGTRPFFAPVHRAADTTMRRTPIGILEPQEGNIPSDADDALKQRRALNQLRQELQAAMDTENFERAAELRDEIHRMEQGVA